MQRRAFQRRGAIECVQVSVADTAPCRSEPARDSGMSANIFASCHTAIASRLTPTGELRCQWWFCSVRRCTASRR
ncbi:hypothetical protein FGA82_00010 [Pseudomonas fluorescens]|nr:hypothetical protein FGA82_00010 [Pseudomonas fluorescens]